MNINYLLNNKEQLYILIQNAISYIQLYKGYYDNYKNFLSVNLYNLDKFEEYLIKEKNELNNVDYDFIENKELKNSFELYKDEFQEELQDELNEDDLIKNNIKNSKFELCRGDIIYIASKINLNFDDIIEFIKKYPNISSEILRVGEVEDNFNNLFCSSPSYFNGHML